MAISFIGKDTQDAAGALALTFTIPGGATTNDFMIAFVKQCENTTQRFWDDDGGGGNGWTREAYNRTTSGRDQETAVYWKIHDGSESNPTFTWASGITSEPMSGALLVYRGVDTVAPFTQVTYASGANDANPPNPTVRIDYDDSWVVCFHAATHDDISTPAVPTGFTSRSQVWNGAADDHRNHFVADINNIDASASPYTPPDWQHSVLNATPEFHTYSVALNEVQPIAVSTLPDQIFWNGTNYTVTGYGFEATQGTGKLEIWSDSTGTIKTSQSIDSWSDTSIQFDAVKGSLPNNTTVYLVVTNDTGDATGSLPLVVGLAGYNAVVLGTKPDHLWRLNNTYDDTGVTGPTRNMTNSVVGTFTFPSTVIAEDNAYALEFDSVTDRREIADSLNMNITISSKERTLAFWVQLGSTKKPMGAIWKEGGGVQNLAFIVGMGGVIMFQLADVAGTRDNVQAVGAIKLKPDRPYHICGRYSHLETTKEARIFIDGEEQPVELTDGNPMTLGIFDSHSGDVTWGDPDNNLETGGTDIAYNGHGDLLINWFGTWSDNSIGPNAGGLDKTTEIRDKLFRRGAPPKFTVATGTESVMQTWVENNLDSSTLPDWPLCLRVDEKTGAGNLRLEATDVEFDDLATMHIEWRGTDTLTWVVLSGNGPDPSKIHTPASGTVVLRYVVSASFTVRNINTKAAISGARVFIKADTGGDLTAGTVLLSDTTTAGGLASFTLEFTNDQPVTGWVRSGTGDKYKESKIVGTVTSAGLNLTAFMIPDEE